MDRTHLHIRALQTDAETVRDRHQTGVGKTELMEVIEALSCNGMKRQGSTTESAISRLFETHGRLTLCLDQLDGMNWENRKLINLLCDGFEVGAVKEMSEVKGSNYTPKPFVIGFPQALGMIGDLPDQARSHRLPVSDPRCCGPSSAARAAFRGAAHAAGGAPQQACSVAHRTDMAEGIGGGADAAWCQVRQVAALGGALPV